MNQQTVFLAGAVALGALFVGSNALFTVDQTQQAIVLQLGEPQWIINRDGTDAGLKVKVPFAQNYRRYDRRILNLVPDGRSEIVTADQERLEVDAFARWRIADPQTFYQAVNTETVARTRLSNQLEASLRRVLGSAQSGDIISGRRAALMALILAEVNRDAQSLGIEVVDVRIRAADLPQANQERVFQRMRSEREQAAALIRSEGDRQAQEIRGTADRERARIIANSFGQDPDFAAFYRSMQAYREALPAGTTIVTTPDSDFFRFFESQRGAGQ
jgi:modulator of FtsH protease HflC